MAGLLDVLPLLDVPFCVASSSQMERIRTSLEITGPDGAVQPGDLLGHHGRARQAGARSLPQGRRDDGRAARGLPRHRRQPGRHHRRQEGRHARVRLHRRRAHRALGPQPADRGAASRRQPVRYARPARPARTASEGGPTAGCGTCWLQSMSARAALAPEWSARPAALLGRAEHPIDMRRTDANHAEHDSEQIWQAIGLAVKRRDARGRRKARGRRRHQLRCHLLAGRARARTALHCRSSDGEDALGHHRLARPPRPGRSRRMHRDRPPGARLHRRRHVARDGSAQADVAEAPRARHLGQGRPLLRSRRLPDLEGLGLDAPARNAR